MRKFLVNLCLCLTLLFTLTACKLAPRVSAEQRMYLDLSLEFLGEYQLPKQKFQNTQVGGLSGITYDRQNNRFYAISDDRSQFAPARFYTLNLHLTEGDRGINLNKIDIEGVTFLKNEQGETYPSGTVDFEGIGLSPRRTLFISSEGAIDKQIPPFVGEFELETGKLRQNIRIPQRFLPDLTKDAQEPRGIQNNMGFEALTVGQSSVMKDDPFRLFTATESALWQDEPPSSPEEKTKVRLLHYSIDSVGSPILVSEYLYLLDPGTNETLSNGLTELLTLEREGFFLSLERTFGLAGFGGKLYQTVVGNATDTSRILALKGNSEKIIPMKKKLLLDLTTLDIELDNIEGMTLGPKLPDGSQTLVLIGDDNFKDEQITQVLLFRLVET
jgi:hypothetical protein